MNKVKKMISVGVVSSTLACTGIGVIAYYSASLKSGYTPKSFSSETDNPSTTATLDSQIAQIDTPSSFYSVDSNEYYQKLNLSSLLTNYSTNLQNESTSNVVAMINQVNSGFKITNLYEDILFFLKTIYQDANQQMGISILEDDFSITNSTVSFDYLVNLTNVTSDTISFQINDDSFYLPANTTKTLEIKTSNSTYHFGLTKNYNSYYLDWNTDVDFIFDDQTYSFKDFSFTNNNYSVAIQTAITGISDTNSYETVSDDQSNYENLTTDFLKTNIDTYLSSNMELVLNLLGYISPILDEAANNPTLFTLLANQKDNISGLILELLGIDTSNADYQSYESLFATLVGSTDSLLNIISSNKTAIASFIALLINNPSITSDVIYTYIKDVDADATDAELATQKDDLEGLISFYISSTGTSIDMDFIDSLMDTIFNKNTTTLSFLSFLFGTESEPLIDLLATTDSQKTTYQTYFELIDLLLDDPTKPVLSVLLSTDGRQLLSDIVTNLMGSNPVQGDTSNSLILSIVQQILDPSNTNLTATTLKDLLTDLIDPLLDFLSDSNNYQLTKSFDNLEYDATNKKITYQYSIVFEFTNSFTFNINSLLEVLPDSLKLGSTSIPKWILDYVLDQDGTALQMTIGVGDKINFTFSGDNESIYLTPVTNASGSHYAGFSFQYKMVMRLDMPTLFNSITSFYKGSGTSVQNPINDKIIAVLTDFLSDYLIRDYDFYGMISLTDKTKTISNYSSNVYYDNNYFKWLQPDDTFYTELKNNITTVTSNSYSLETIQDGVDNVTSSYSTVSGNKPEIINNFEDTIKSSIMEYNSDIDPIITITPEVYSSIPITFIGATLGSIDVTLVEVQVWFPYSVVNLTDENNLEFGNSFSVEINLS